MNEEEARRVIVLIARSLADNNSYPSTITNYKTKELKSYSGSFAPTMINMTESETGRKIWGKGTETMIEVYYDSTSNKVELERSGTRITKAYDRRNSVEYYKVDADSSTVKITGGGEEHQYQT